MNRRARRYGRISLGSLLVIVGVVLIPLPGPGVLIVIAGLAVMAEEVPAADRAMKALKRRLKAAEQKVLRKAKEEIKEFEEKT